MLEKERIMGLIQCAESCKYQSDGYCSLNNPSVVNSVSGICPYLIPQLLNNRDSLAESSDTD